MSRMIGINNHWVRQKTYGGRLVENCTQAIARDILSNSHVDIFILRMYIDAIGGKSHEGGNMATSVKEYTAHVDAKKRISIRGARYQYYAVKEYDNGCIILEPRELTAPFEISAKTLADMDQAVNNFRSNEESEPVDLSDF